MPETTKSVFVPTGDVRLPRRGEWFRERNGQMSQAAMDFAFISVEIYEEVKVRASAD
jgi:hypothetical protein